MDDEISAANILINFEDRSIKHAKLMIAQEWFRELRKTTTLGPRTPKKCVTLFAPPQAGKSKTIRHYIETVVVDDAIKRGMFDASIERHVIAAQQKIVIHVTLSQDTTVKSLAQDILTALGDPRADKGSANDKLRRVYDYLRKFGVELLVIDETQHLSHQTGRSAQTRNNRSGDRKSVAPTDALKNMLLDGLVPIVFVGILEAKQFIMGEYQIAERCIEQIDFSPQNFTEAAERKEFTSFIGKIGIMMKEEGLFPEISNFVAGDIPFRLHEAAGGSLGGASNLIRAAALIAQGERARCVTRDHLLQAVDSWSIPRRIVKQNPFRKAFVQ